MICIQAQRQWVNCVLTVLENVFAMKLSVIIPFYNPHPVHFAEMLDGLRHANYSGFTQIQVILINDGGTDTVHADIEKWAADCPSLHVQLIAMPTNQGVSCARNAGLTAATGDWIAFHDADHGDGRPAETGGALPWLDALVQRERIEDATGEVWLKAFPSVLGHAFKPVSFWYAQRTDGSLAAIVAEVNNTFGERHCYLLPEPQYGQTMLAHKVFHVSPFCDVQGEYRFRFMRVTHGGQDRIVARVDHGDADGPLIDTSWSGVLEPATAAALRRVMWRFPLLTFGVVARIHWHALLLWLKKVPFWRKPELPRDFVTR